MQIVKALDIFYKIAVKQNLILSKRVKLIRAMISALSVVEDSEEKEYLQNVIDVIRQDEFGHFLSISLNDNNTVSYSRSEDTKLSQYPSLKEGACARKLNQFSLIRLNIALDKTENFRRL